MIRRDSTDRGAPYRTLGASVTQDQARLVFDKIRELLATSQGQAFAKRAIAAIRQSPFPHIKFRNGSECWFRSTYGKGSSLLGWDFDLITFDEAACEPHLESVVNEVLLMRLADRNGRLDFVSTGRGKNAYYRRVQEATRRDDCYVQTGATKENPHISSKFVKDIEKRMPERLIQQNLEGGFSDDGQELIRTSDVELAFSQGTGCCPPQSDREYCTGVDLARKRTYTTIYTLDTTEIPYQLVAWERFRHMSWEHVISRIEQRRQEYRGRLVVDATGIGDVILERLQAQGFTEGFLFNVKSAADLTSSVQLAFERHEVGLPWIEAIDDDGSLWTLSDELRALSWEHLDRCDRDSFIALGLAIWCKRFATKPPPGPDPRVAGLGFSGIS